MRKYGKYERMPDGTRAKPPSAKSMLLQTYFTGLVSMILCVTMFFSTTYAWFVSDVNNEANEIYVGSLSVGLYKESKVAGENPLDLADSRYKLFDNSIMWKPGYTSLETIRVVNEGDLAFKYVLTFTADETATNAANGKTTDLEKIADCFDVWVFDHTGKNYVAPQSYDGINPETGWVHIGTLEDVLDGKTVLDGKMEEKPIAAAAEENSNEVKTVDTYTIALHMKNEASAEVKGQKIVLNVKLIAYQTTSKNDVGINSYDAVKFVTSEEDLRSVVANATEKTTIVVVDDIKLTEPLNIAAGKTIILDMNGKTISQSLACTESYQMINNKGNLTITGNGVISLTDTSAGDPTFGWGSYTIRNEGALVVENGTIEHLGKQNENAVQHMYCAIFQYSGSTTINGGKISTPTYRSLRLWNGDMTINGGTFEGQVWFQCVADDASLVINGGSFGPRGVDGSSVFVNNAKDETTVYDVEFKVTGGNFATKIGADKPDSLAGSITGGNFTDEAKEKTAEVLFSAK